MKFYGQSSKRRDKIPIDKFLYERYFKSLNNFKGVCLECGAADGETISSTKFFEETLGWKCINIEPHPDSYAKLILNRPNSLNINMALSNIETEVNFMIGPNYYLRAHITRDNEICDKSKGLHLVKVKTIPYRKIIEANKINNLDLMVLDVEGHEMEALKGMVGSTVLPKVLCVEFNHIGKDIITNMVAEMGYVLDTQSYINTIYILK